MLKEIVDLMLPTRIRGFKLFIVDPIQCGHVFNLSHLNTYLSLFFILCLDSRYFYLRNSIYTCSWDIFMTRYQFFFFSYQLFELKLPTFSTELPTSCSIQISTFFYRLSTFYIKVINLFDWITN